jgi:hypothetical protein
LIDLTLTKIGTFLVIIDKGGEKSHKDKKLSYKGGERVQLKLSTQVGGASS